MGNTAKARHRRRRRARIQSPAIKRLASIMRSDARRLRRIGPEARERLRRWWQVNPPYAIAEFVPAFFRVPGVKVHTL